MSLLTSKAFREEIMETVASVLTRGNLILRDELRVFESNLAAFVGTEYAVGVNSGSDALHLTLRALGIGHGNEVISVSHTCVATISAIVHAEQPRFSWKSEQISPWICPKWRRLSPHVLVPLSPYI